MHRGASYTVAPLLLCFVACASAPESGHPAHSSSTTGAFTTGVGAGTGGAGPGGASSAEGAGGVGGTGGASDAGAGDASPDGGTGTDCSVDGFPGKCMMVSSCAALPGYSSTPGFCPGPADIECCTMAPSVADNPPIPAGYKLMAQADVTQAMTDWAVSILDDHTTYPMFSTAMKTFGTLMVLARVEWHSPDFQNNKVHRGVTLYEPG